MLRDRPVHKQADKLKSDKKFKEGTKPFIEHRLERKVQGAFTYQLKVVHSRSTVSNAVLCVSLSFVASFILAKTWNITGIRIY